MPFTKPVFCAALSLGASISAVFAETPTPYPFVGTWDCEVATFTFTDTTYNNGSEDMAIRSVSKDGTNFELTFDDGYMISLGGITDTSISWVSGETFDQFDCTRLK